MEKRGEGGRGRGKFLPRTSGTLRVKHDLREHPAHNTSSSSIQLKWSPPEDSTIHGEFLGYRIAFKPRTAVGGDAVQEIRIKDPLVSRYTIQKLEIFTQYLVSLQVYNPEGLGPSTTVVVMTDEGGN